MLVYRVCDEDEVFSILKNGSLDGIGCFYSTDSKKSTHIYHPNKKYLHFFENYNDVFYLDSSKKQYICTYDIAEDFLEKSRGIGYYLDRIFFESLQEVFEFAVDFSLLRFQNLIQIDQIIDTILFDALIIQKIKTKEKKYFHYRLLI